MLQLSTFQPEPFLGHFVATLCVLAEADSVKAVKALMNKEDAKWKLKDFTL